MEGPPWDAAGQWASWRACRRGGNGGEVRIVIHRADYGAHRAGKELRESITFAGAIPLMPAHDEAGLEALFRHDHRPDEPQAPNRLPSGGSSSAPGRGRRSSPRDWIVLTAGT